MKTKFNLDRKPLESSFINSKQDFDKVIKGYQAMKPPIWKNPWFYGPAGLASLAIILTLTFQNNILASDNNSTLSEITQKSENQLPEDTPCLNPVSNHSDIEFESFSIDPKKGGTIQTKNQSIIQIAPNSLLTHFDGPVTIKVREFPDQASAFIAGVPMDYGKKSAFESGGMIEIRGEQNGKKVEIASDKPIAVNMTLHNSGDDFKFWSLNDKTGEWTEYPCAFTSNSKGNITRIVTSVRKSPELIQIQSKIEICEKEIINLEKSDKKQALIPEENARKLVVEFNPKQFPELAGYKDIEFEYLLPEVRSESNMIKFEKSIQYASSQTWNDMNVSKNAENFIVTFKNRKESYSVPVRPVLKGGSLSQLENQIAKAEAFKKAEIVRLEKEKLALEKREIELQAKYESNVAAIKTNLNNVKPVNEQVQNPQNQTSTQIQNVAAGFNGERGNFLTTGFGLFNCDKPNPYPKLFASAIVCKAIGGAAIQVASAFVFDLKNKTRFTFGQLNGKKIEDLAWSRNNSTLILIDMQGNLYYKKEVNNEPLDNFTLILDRIDKKDVNLNEIQKLVGETNITA
jgi:hypothetical protein